MIADERLVGMLYLQKTVLDGKKVLVMAIQPRSFWNVNHRDLLKKIEEAGARKTLLTGKADVEKITEMLKPKD